MVAPALNPLIGYEGAAALAEEAFREGRRIEDAAAETTDIPSERLREILDPAEMAGE